MGGNDMIAPVRASVRVVMDNEDAFRNFVYELRRWWPLAFTYSLDRFALAAIEPLEGGRWYEVDNTGRKIVWGEVRAFEPPNRVVLSYAISPTWEPEPPERASEVEIRFDSEQDSTNVERPVTLIEVIHRDFACHGEKARDLRNRLASPRGWSLILTSFARRFTN